MTAREAEVLAAIGRRLTNREIAARLSLSVRTVESHVSSLLRKLGFSGRPELVELAQQLTGGQLIPMRHNAQAVWHPPTATSCARWWPRPSGNMGSP